MLYASVGDAGNRSEAQDRDSLAGKILRVTPDGTVPDDNPFDGSPVWSLGHRNVQGMGWAADGTMFAAEFGENRWDELNVVEPGKDYGWPEVEGTGGEDRGFVDPVQQWSTDEASPSGLTVIVTPSSSRTSRASPCGVCRCPTRRPRPSTSPGTSAASGRCCRAGRHALVRDEQHRRAAATPATVTTGSSRSP